MSPAITIPGPIAPHGGTLVDRFDDSLDEGGARPRVTLSARQQADLDLIAVGAMSPLDGFMGREAYEAVVSDMRLPSGLAWSVPVTLAVSPEALAHVGSSDEVELVDETGRFLGVLEVTDRYEVDPVREARLVYGTEEAAHPGVASLYAHGTTCLAGPVRVGGRLPLDPGAAPFLLDPRRSREEFDARGWRSVVGFQTRNPIHRAHEYITKVALETVDGLFLHPLVGETKSDDIPADVRMALLPGPDRGLLPHASAWCWACCRPRCATPAPARPCCTRSCARTTAARTSSWAATTPAWAATTAPTTPTGSSTTSATRSSASSRCSSSTPSGASSPAGMATTKTSPAGPEDRVFLSGTKVREMLDRGEIPPVEFTRPEVAEILIEAYANAAA